MERQRIRLDKGQRQEAEEDGALARQETEPHVSEEYKRMTRLAAAAARRVNNRQAWFSARVKKPG
jgi:hypothetical protein